jgi:hypothetical protein
MAKTPAEIYAEAFAAGAEAGAKCIPRPMGVYQSDLAGNRLGPTEVVSEGLCGFAWVRIKPARGPFVKYLKDNNIGHLSLYGGWMISMGDCCGMSQSMERKEAAGRAFVEVLKRNGIERAWMESRLD